MSRYLLTLILAVGLATFVACQSEQPGSPSDEVAKSDPKERAAEAKDALFEKLSGRLMRTMMGQGPVAAIEVCRQDAPEIAAEVGQTHHVNIGRTSMKLRNPKNQPPDWAKSLLETLPKEPQFMELSDGGLGAIYPILLQQRCLMCHGPAEQLSPDVRAKLAELYPDDQATGFQEGDLRGWFWVEVPGTSAPARK